MGLILVKKQGGWDSAIKIHDVVGTPTQLSTETKDDLNLFGLAYVGSQGEGLVGISNHSSHITFDGGAQDQIFLAKACTALIFTNWCIVFQSVTVIAWMHG